MPAVIPNRPSTFYDKVLSEKFKKRFHNDLDKNFQKKILILKRKSKKRILYSFFSFYISIVKLVNIWYNYLGIR